MGIFWKLDLYKNSPVFHSSPINSKENMMLTYTLLALAAIFVLNRWIQFTKIRRNAAPLDSIDTEFKQQLNSGDPHEK
jgi:hypothetical protein